MAQRERHLSESTVAGGGPPEIPASLLQHTFALVTDFCCPVCSWLSPITTFWFGLVFQELRSKQTQLSSMEWLQTGTLRISEVLRERGPVALDIHGPNSFREQNLTAGNSIVVRA